ncbi:KPTN [Bugula neritina]|uniref:KPTN n=1 Tax=Bugula neritina TaxID=10212 RepID=A0A7J7J9P1_BUGNE|nr:KPTN [Bugula neritina]
MPTGTQSNVYGMSHYTTHASNSKSTCEKVLMACLNGDITLFEYALSDSNEPKPENNLFRAPYISENSEIVSLDSFTKLSAATGQSVIVLGITFINNIGQGASGFTAIYTAPLRLETPFYRSMEMVTDKGLPAAMEGIHVRSLMHICSVNWRIFKHGVSSTVFLVSTTCPKVHLFKEKLGKSSESTYKESSVGKYFSELQRETESSIYFMDILYYEDNKYRLTCTGTEQGKITFFMVDVAENGE